jgi:hypothetical protein
LPAQLRDLNDLHAPSHAALAVDHLAAFFGPHSCAKANGPRTLQLARFMGVMHDL